MYSGHPRESIRYLHQLTSVRESQKGPAATKGMCTWITTIISTCRFLLSQSWHFEFHLKDVWVVLFSVIFENISQVGHKTHQLLFFHLVFFVVWPWAPSPLVGCLPVLNFDADIVTLCNLGSRYLCLGELCEKAVSRSFCSLELHFSSGPCPCLCLSYVTAMFMSSVTLHLISWCDPGSASLSQTCLAISDSWLSWLLTHWNGSWPWFADLIVLLKLVYWHSGPLADCGYCHSSCFTHLAQVLGDSTLGNDVPDCACLAVSLQSTLPFPKDLFL